MRVAVLFNPVAGAGRAAARADSAARALRGAGHEVALESTRVAAEAGWLDRMLEGVEVLVVLGGDGAVRMAAGAASRSGSAIYQLPMGTENLFAREFGMDQQLPNLLRALEKLHLREVDVGQANGEDFLLMASVGYDAEVVHDLAARRGASISHWSYLAPVWAQFWRWKPPRLEVLVDGERIDDGGPGFVVIGNCRQYGWRLNPCGRARMDDGLLDVAYFPASGRAALAKWAVQCRLQRHLANSAVPYRVGRHVRISSAVGQRYQLDGDPPGVTGQGKSARSKPEGNGTGPGFQLDIQVRERALKVLLP